MSAKGLVADTALNKGSMVMSGSIATQFVIFNDPIYYYVAIAGALVSTLGFVHEVTHSKDGLSLWASLSEAVKAAVLGLIATPMWFMAFMHTGGTVIEKFTGLSGFHGITNSFYLLLSLILAWWTIPIITFFVSKIRSRA